MKPITMKPAGHSNSRGVTLIEVLVAIVIFAVLGIMSYRAISQAVAARERLETEFSDWQGLSRALGRVETDLLQVGARNGSSSTGIPTNGSASVGTEESSSNGNPVSAASGTSAVTTGSLPAITFTQYSNGGSRLMFWRLDVDQGARLTGFEFVDGSLDLLRWPTADLSQAPRREKLLTDVTSVRWAFVSADNPVWVDKWPPTSGRAGEMPVGISIELGLTKFGKISRVFAIN